MKVAQITMALALVAIPALAGKAKAPPKAPPPAPAPAPSRIPPGADPCLFRCSEVEGECIRRARGNPHARQMCSIDYAQCADACEGEE